MIRINRPVSIPPILSSNGSRRTTALKRKFLLDKQAYLCGDKKFRFDSAVYADHSVRQSLIDAQSGKCCYCEAKFQHLHLSGDVEHFRPKGFSQQRTNGRKTFPGYYWLGYDWENLLVSCTDCNQRHKKNLFPLYNPRSRARGHQDNLSAERPMLIDPSVRDPMAFIEFRCEVAFPKKRSRLGQASISTFGLNRNHLRQNRFLWLNQIIPSIKFVASNHPDEPQRLEAREFLNAALSPRGQYAAMLKDNGHW